MSLQTLLPEGWPQPRGYANGIVVPAGARLIFTAGMVGWDKEERLVGGDDFVAQFAQALRNVVSVVREGGGEAEHIVRLTFYVTDKARYLASLEALGPAYREVMGRHFPCMALVEVSRLVEDGALVEVEGTAAIPGG